MKRLFQLLVFLFLMGLGESAFAQWNNTSLGGGWTGVSSVGTTSGSSSVSSESAGAFTHNPPLSSLIFVYQFYSSGSSTCTTPVDTIGNTFTEIGSTVLFNTSGNSNCSWYAVNKTAAADTVTCHISSAATFFGCIADNASGNATTGVLDKNCAATANTTTSGAGGQNVVCSASITPSVGGELILAGSALSGGSGTETAGTNFTLIVTTQVGTEYYMQATAAPLTPSFSYTLSGVPYGMIAASFKPATTVVVAQDGNEGYLFLFAGLAAGVFGYLLMELGEHSFSPKPLAQSVAGGYNLIGDSSSGIVGGNVGGEPWRVPTPPVVIDEPEVQHQKPFPQFSIGDVVASESLEPNLEVPTPPMVSVSSVGSSFRPKLSGGDIVESLRIPTSPTSQFDEQDHSRWLGSQFIQLFEEADSEYPIIIVTVPKQGFDEIYDKWFGDVSVKDFQIDEQTWKVPGAKDFYVSQQEDYDQAHWLGVSYPFDEGGTESEYPIIIVVVPKQGFDDLEYSKWLGVSIPDLAMSEFLEQNFQAPFPPLVSYAGSVSSTSTRVVGGGGDESWTTPPSPTSQFDEQDHSRWLGTQFIQLFEEPESEYPVIVVVVPKQGFDDSEYYRWLGQTVVMDDGVEPWRVPTPPVFYQDDFDTARYLEFRVIVDEDTQLSITPTPPVSKQDDFDIARFLESRAVVDDDTQLSITPAPPVSKQDDHDYAHWIGIQFVQLHEDDWSDSSRVPTPPVSITGDEPDSKFVGYFIGVYDDQDTSRFEVPTPPVAQQDDHDLAKWFGIQVPLDEGGTESEYPVVVVVVPKQGYEEDPSYSKWYGIALPDLAGLESVEPSFQVPLPPMVSYAGSVSSTSTRIAGSGGDESWTTPSAPISQFDEQDHSRWLGTQFIQLFEEPESEYPIVIVVVPKQGYEEDQSYSKWYGITLPDLAALESVEPTFQVPLPPMVSDVSSVLSSSIRVSGGGDGERWEVPTPPTSQLDDHEQSRWLGTQFIQLFEEPESEYPIIIVTIPKQGYEDDQTYSKWYGIGIPDLAVLDSVEPSFQVPFPPMVSDVSSVLSAGFRVAGEGSTDFWPFSSPPVSEFDEKDYSRWLGSQFIQLFEEADSEYPIIIVTVPKQGFDDTEYYKWLGTQFIQLFEDQEFQRATVPTPPVFYQDDFDQARFTDIHVIVDEGIDPWRVPTPPVSYQDDFDTARNLDISARDFQAEEQSARVPTPPISQQDDHEAARNLDISARDFQVEEQSAKAPTPPVFYQDDFDLAKFFEVRLITDEDTQQRGQLPTPPFSYREPYEDIAKAWDTHVQDFQAEEQSAKAPTPPVFYQDDFDQSYWIEKRFLELYDYIDLVRIGGSILVTVSDTFSFSDNIGVTYVYFIFKTLRYALLNEELNYQLLSGILRFALLNEELSSNVINHTLRFDKPGGPLTF